MIIATIAAALLVVSGGAASGGALKGKSGEPSSVSPAVASEEERARTEAARTLFSEGLREADRRRWPEAADRFARAYALRPTAEIAYNLSTALIGEGRLLWASELLGQIDGDQGASREVRAAAAARLGQLLPRLGHLTVKIDPAVSGSAALDGQLLDAGRLGSSFPVDPGPHRVELFRPGRTPLSRFVSLSEGGSATIELRDSPVAVGPLVGLREDPLPPRPSEPAPARHGHGWLWGAAGALLVGAGIAFFVAQSGGQAPRGNVETWTLGR